MIKIKEKINKIIEYLIYIFIFFVTLQTRYIFSYLTLDLEQFEYGKLSIYFTDIIFLVIFLLFIFFKIKEIKSFRLNGYFYFTYIFFIICTISYFFAENIQIYFYSLFRIFECISMLYILQFIKIDWKKILYMFIFSMILHSILAYFQFFNQDIVANKYLGISSQIASSGGVSVLENNYGRFLRVYGGFSHPNIFAGFLVLSIIFLIILFLKNSFNDKFGKIFFWTNLLFLFQVLILTFSRSGFLALAVCFLFLFIYFFLKKKVKIILSIFVVMSVFFIINLLIFKDLISPRVEQLNRLEQKSINDRSFLSNQAYQILKSNWMSGVGLGNYIPYVYKNVNSNLNIWDYQPVHNVYLLIFSELGILGLLFYISIFLSSVFLKIKERKYFFILPILVILIINFFDHYFWTSWSGLITSFLILII
ncbi:MAG: O-antigen ligase family protein [Patescibacteria group bacterium]|nr:O-antigen ligase family protein [Patescibacteria group bacterium]